MTIDELLKDIGYENTITLSNITKYQHFDEDGNLVKQIEKKNNDYKDVTKRIKAEQELEAAKNDLAKRSL